MNDNAHVAPCYQIATNDACFGNTHSSVAVAVSVRGILLKIIDKSVRDSLSAWNSFVGTAFRVFLYALPLKLRRVSDGIFCPYAFSVFSKSFLCGIPPSVRLRGGICCALRRPALHDAMYASRRRALCPTHVQSTNII